MSTTWRRVRQTLAALVIVALPLLLVLPFHPESSLYGDFVQSAPWWLRPWTWIVFEWGGNVVAFAAFTIAVAAFVRRTPVVLLIGCATSAALELAQLVVPDRVASLGDFVLNSFGAVIGTLVVLLVRQIGRRSTPRPHARLRRS